MAQEVLLALELQRMDRQLAQLEAEIRGLPKKIAEMSKMIEANARRLEADQLALKANQAEIRRLGNINNDQRARIEKLKKQTMQATTQEQLNAFQKEIAFCEAEIVKNDEASVALIEEGEKMTARVAEAEKALEAEKASLDKRTEEAKELSEADRKKGVKIYRARQEYAKTIPPKIMDMYDKLRRKHKDGIVVADCSEGICSACMMKIRPALMQQIRSEDAKIHLCEACGRMLNYNAPQSVDGTIATTPISS